MKFSTVCSWLEYIGSVHSTEIDLGLDRITLVAKKLGVLSFSCPVITVAGTNGKGSVVAGLDAIYQAQGYKTACFTSPHLFVHNEKARVCGVSADDAAWVQAFDKIESTRAEVSLTPFEYHTLAALLIFKKEKPDVLLMEVGLGGRLDAVNVLDADLSVVTSIGIDHVAWLGNTREAIGKEKAGVFRKDRPAVCGDATPPESLIHYAKEVGAQLYVQGKDFHYKEHGTTWDWSFDERKYVELAKNNLLTQNMSTVLTVVTLMQEKLTVSEENIRSGLANISLPGRQQVIPGDVTKVIDVAHNPAAISELTKKLQLLANGGKTLAVFSMLNDKDIAESVNLLKDQIDQWFVAELDCDRATPKERLASIFADLNLTNVTFCESIGKAGESAAACAKPSDVLVVCGSFNTVAEYFRDASLCDAPQVDRE